MVEQKNILYVHEDTIEVLVVFDFIQPLLAIGSVDNCMATEGQSLRQDSPVNLIVLCQPVRQSPKE
jgi:hypothetical protein